MSRPTTSRSVSSSYPTYPYYEYTTTASRNRAGQASKGRSNTARPRTGVSTLAVTDQQIICAVSESRGVAPTVGLAFVNLDTGEAALSQICDNQTYVRTLAKLAVYCPSQVLIMSTAANPKSKLFCTIEDHLDAFNGSIILLDRRYWAENAGFDYIQQLAFAEDIEAIKLAIGTNYFAVCCIAAALKYIELGMSTTFPFQSLRIKYEPSEGSMMIDISTIRSLELIQNLENPKSEACLFGLLNDTLTPMGSRLLRSNILQPLTDPNTLSLRYDALEELTTMEEMFFATRAGSYTKELRTLKNSLDSDRVLSALIVIPAKISVQYCEQSINNVIMLKHFLNMVNPIFNAVSGARSELLHEIRDLCRPENLEAVEALIYGALNEDTAYAKQPLELRNQRTYAMKSGVNGLLDVARQTYKEAVQDADEHVQQLGETHRLPLEMKFDNMRGFYIRVPVSELEDRALPATFTNVFRKKNKVECQTLDLMKMNQKVCLFPPQITDSHAEVVMLCDRTVQDLVVELRSHLSILFKISEAISMLDMMAAFASVVTACDYVRPQIGRALALKAARHPVKENDSNVKFVPNDVYATQQTRFQIITGCNMSGKSTYIRSVALMSVMAQIGSFVPAEYAAFPIMYQLFARVSADDSIEANVSTFAAEMREMAFILHNIDRRSLAIVDELGRGTSSQDGLAIALAIAEALISSRAMVWFATHFRDLARFLEERAGVINLHLQAEMTQENEMSMLYKLAQGAVQEQHYGIKMAKLMPLPPDVIEYAEVVATRLQEQINKRKRTSFPVLRERRRKLILNLKEHLLQAQSGQMEGEVLTSWLRELQREFVVRMMQIEKEAEEARIEEEIMSDTMTGDSQDMLTDAGQSTT
ncbi:DNA mismatch repair protein-like protein MutS [Viridothelium virens]|uniref:DNA mismatch repair protein-like protein MutS n=1 Tax=Viridothelium virens TaxID=1048519 RepID=A0A6A6HI35_VIRVR|nr:DNA mismatch repair protein-like protein MutS [Viridothelium virens]